MNTMTPWACMKHNEPEGIRRPQERALTNRMKPNEPITTPRERPNELKYNQGAPE